MVTLSLDLDVAIFAIGLSILIVINRWGG